MTLDDFVAAQQGDDRLALDQPWVRRIVSRIDVTDSCWLWTGHLDTCGYGRYSSLPSAGLAPTSLAHRIVYLWLVGPIPGDLDLDHLCRVRNCVNPDHLEPVTAEENNRRSGRAKTRCPRGHKYTAANTYRHPDGRRQCRACRYERVPCEFCSELIQQHRRLKHLRVHHPGEVDAYMASKKAS